MLPILRIDTGPSIEHQQELELIYPDPLPSAESSSASLSSLIDRGDPYCAGGPGCKQQSSRSKGALRDQRQLRNSVFCFKFSEQLDRQRLEDAFKGLYNSLESTEEQKHYLELFATLARMYGSEWGSSSSVRSELLQQRGRTVLATLHIAPGRFLRAPVPTARYRGFEIGKPWKAPVTTEMLRERRHLRVLEERQQSRDLAHWKRRNTASTHNCGEKVQPLLTRDVDNILQADTKARILPDSDKQTFKQAASYDPPLRTLWQGHGKALAGVDDWFQPEIAPDVGYQSEPGPADLLFVSRLEKDLSSLLFTHSTSHRGNYLERRAGTLIQWKIPKWDESPKSDEIPDLLLPSPVTLDLELQDADFLPTKHNISRSVSPKTQLPSPPKVQWASTVPTTEESSPVLTYSTNPSTAPISAVEKGPGLSRSSSSGKSSLHSIKRFLVRARGIPWISRSPTDLPSSSTGTEVSSPTSSFIPSSFNTSPMLKASSKSPLLKASFFSRKPVFARPTSPPHPGTKVAEVSSITLFADTTTVQERIRTFKSDVAAAAKTEPAEMTRSEAEYQEVVSSLQKLRREMKLEKDKIQSPITRGRSPIKTLTDVIRSRSNSRERSRRMHRLRSRRPVPKVNRNTQLGRD